jgi:tetratricopeptide (TPR) repeat protein
METLKKILVMMLMAISIQYPAHSQTFAELQKAFAASIIAEAKGNYTEAVNQITPVYSDKNYECNLRLGWLYYLLQNYTKSESFYKVAVALKPYSVEAKLGYIKPLSVLESWDIVLKQYEEILKIDPQNYSANYWAGIIHYNRKKYDAAAKYFEKIVNLFPFDYDANHMLGWTYLFQGKKAEAKVLFQQALLIRTSDASALDGLSKT